MKKRYSAFILAFLLMISAFCSCTEKNISTSDKNKASDTYDKTFIDSDTLRDTDADTAESIETETDARTEIGASTDTESDKPTDTSASTEPVLYETGEISPPYVEKTPDIADISSYVIVIPSKSDVYSYYTALLFAEKVNDTFGIVLSVVEDRVAKRDKEILIGDTSREEDDISFELKSGEYLLAFVGKKIVIRGYGIYAAAAAGALAAKHLDTNSSGKVGAYDLPKEHAVKLYTDSAKKADNVILMIGDGMGYNHVDAALGNGLSEFAANSFICKGSAVTKSWSVIDGKAGYTDSAAAATALACGYKTVNGYVGKDKNGNDVQNVRELAHAYGAKTAVITTDAITGATPASFLAHNISRNNTSELSKDITALKYGGLVNYCEGDVADGLTDNVRIAISNLSNTGSPFFMMVEEGYIDKHSHNNDLSSTMSTVRRFNDAIIYASCYTLIDGNTVLIVTADHETGGLVEDETLSVGYKYTSVNHTNADVPFYAIGNGASSFYEKKVDNTDIADFIATHFGAKSFGEAA